MIKANELRIGNLFQEENTKEIIEVICIKSKKYHGADAIYFSGDFEHEWKAEPIPLTEEWWPKFGYEAIQEFITCLLEDSAIPLGDDFNFWVPYIEGLPIHKIQNLWYEHTGGELTIK